MNSVADQTAVFSVALTEEERAQVLNWLEQMLREKLVEEHRTDALAYKDFVAHQKGILESVIRKLRSES